MKRLALLFFAVLAISAVNRPAVADSGSQVIVQSMAEEVVGLLNDANLQKPQRIEGLRSLLSKYMDLPFVGRFVLGQRWRPLSAGAKAEYTRAFEDYVVSVYAKRLDSYAGETINVSGSRQVNARDTLVSSAINRSNGPPVAVVWRVRDKKIIDVSVEGVSMAISQRDEFNAFLQNKSVDDLITRLKRESAS